MNVILYLLWGLPAMGGNTRADVSRAQIGNNGGCIWRQE
jgi:hypothetical protein